jgi:SAM-dependent methyltransferase
MFESIPASAASAAWRVWYPLLTGLARDAPVSFLNFGYDGSAAAGALALSPSDEPDRPCAQLYHRVAVGVDLAGRRALEVSCGHGGGASYVARYFGPAAVHGVDGNPRAIALCRRRHRGVPGLSFSRGDALALPSPAETYDAVLSVEASHCYRDLPQFLAEVHRVLRPGGRLLFADFRSAGPPLATLARELAAGGLTVEREEDVSAGLVRGMRLNTPRYLDLARRLALPSLWPVLARFAGVEGSPIYRVLASGRFVYVRYVLRKPGPAASLG